MNRDLGFVEVLEMRAGNGLGHDPVVRRVRDKRPARKMLIVPELCLADRIFAKDELRLAAQRSKPRNGCSYEVLGLLGMDGIQAVADLPEPAIGQILAGFRDEPDWLELAYS